MNGKWDGDSWDAVENVSVTNSAHNEYHLLADGDVVHLAFEDVPGQKLYYRQRSAAGVWSAEVRLNPSLINAIPTMTLIDHNLVRVYWLQTNTIVHRDVRGGGAVGTTTTLVQDETTPSFANLLSLNAIPTTTAPMVAYVTKTATPWDVVVVRQVKK